MTTTRPQRRTQAERRAASRTALIEAAARGISRQGYTRGALYHQFPSKEALALAIVVWIGETWEAEVGPAFAQDQDPAATLVDVAREHAIYCRSDAAAVMQMLHVEFSQRDHPVGQAVGDLMDELLTRIRRLITAGRRQGTIPPGPPVADSARAFIGVLEAVAVSTGGRRPHDVELTVRAVRGILGLPPGTA